MTERPAEADPLFLRQENLRRGMEMLFYAYRDFITRPDEILAAHGLGRAHHRAIYFIGRYPGITMTEMLDILHITKQSLSRVLADLVARGLVEQRTGPEDRRQRLLYLSEDGQKLEQELSSEQAQRFARAYSAAGAEAVAGFRAVLLGMIDPADHWRFRDIADKPSHKLEGR